MKITKEWLKEKGAELWPWEGLTEWFSSQKETDGVKIIKTLIADNKFNEAAWFLVHLMQYKQYVSFAVFAIEQVMDSCDKEQPENKMPREAIKAIKRCINAPSKESRAAAQAIGCLCACVPGDIFGEIGYVVDTAVTAAVQRIAPAAGVAALRACKAGGKEVRTNIFNYGIELLKEKNR